MRFTWKSKQNAAVQPSLTHRIPQTCPQTSTESRIVFSRFPRLAEKTNSFSQFQPTGIRLSTSVFVKLKGLYSQRRAARRNFPLLVFLLDFLYGHCASDQSRLDNRICCKYRLRASPSARRGQKSKKNAVLRRELVRLKGMRGGRRDALRLSGMWLMPHRNNDCDQLSKGLPALKRIVKERRGRLHSSRAD